MMGECLRETLLFVKSGYCILRRRLDPRFARLFLVAIYPYPLIYPSNARLNIQKNHNQAHKLTNPMLENFPVHRQKDRTIITILKMTEMTTYQSPSVLSPISLTQTISAIDTPFTNTRNSPASGRGK
jgi:hypothetical protein